MVFFITVLRALAACLITNSHYTGIYPTDLIANGGLIGDILFFAVSGYCLYHIKLSFPRWYGKRLWRVFLPVWLGTAVLLLTGGYHFADMPWYEWFFYPTYYHFVASIILLYIPFYIVVRIKPLREHLLLVMGGGAAVMLVVYFAFYDRSYYHIDTVREPFIRFLFMESMLLGAYFKQKEEKYRNSFSWWHVVGTFISFVVYFASKLVFSRYTASFGILGELQIINQVLIFVLLYFIFRLFGGLDAKLSRLPAAIRKVIGFIADMTLEIYIVQYVLISVLRRFGLMFPLNWLVITAAIILAAWVLHWVCKLIYRLVDHISEAISDKRKSARGSV